MIDHDMALVLIGGVIGAVGALVGAVVGAWIQHLLSLRTDRIKRERDKQKEKEEERKEALLGGGGVLPQSHEDLKDLSRLFAQVRGEDLPPGIRIAERGVSDRPLPVGPSIRRIGHGEQELKDREGGQDEPAE